MGPIKEILAESQFQEELTTSSQAKLVVVDFTASWCGPCQTIAPFYEQLSRKYPNAVFLKVDVDKCQETAVNQRVSVMPTFHFYRNKVKVDSIQGADPQKLEEKILKYYDEGTGENDVGVAGHKKEGDKSKNEAGCVGPDSLKASSSTKNVQAKALRVTSTSKLTAEVPTGACVSPANTKDGAQSMVTEPLSVEYILNNNIPSAEIARTNIFSRLTLDSKEPDVSGVKSGDASVRITAALPAGTTLNDTSKTIVKETSQKPNEPGQKGPVEVSKAVCSDQNLNSVDKLNSTIVNPSTMPSKQLQKTPGDNPRGSISKAPTAMSSKMSQKEAISQDKSSSAAPKAAVDVQKKTAADKPEDSSSKTPSAIPSKMPLKEGTSQDKSSSTPKGPTVAASDGVTKNTPGDKPEGEGPTKSDNASSPSSKQKAPSPQKK